MLAHLQPFLLLSRLAKCLEILTSAGVDRLDKLWRDLLSDDPRRVKSALHEIRIAATFQLAGFQVNIIETGAGRTPDFLLDNEVEVECKHKLRASEIDKARQAMYDLLNRKLRNIFAGDTDCGALVVLARFHVEPTRPMIDEITESARKIVRGGTPTAVEKSGPQFDYTVEGIATEDIDYGAEMRISRRPNRLDSPYEIEINSGIGMTLADGTPGIGKRLFLLIGCDVEHDFIKSLRSSLKSAAGQFSGSLPAIIIIDVTDILDAISEEPYFEQVSALIRTFLRSNTTVSRVGLEFNWFESGSEGAVLKRRFAYFENENARNPLPPKYAPRALR